MIPKTERTCAEVHVSGVLKLLNVPDFGTVLCFSSHISRGDLMMYNAVVD